MNNVKKLSSLLIFTEVANNQSFTLAANKLSMSKSAVSQHIKRLEKDIGQQLLSRHTRGMSLTAAGKKLLSRCELLRDQVDIAYDELNLSKEAPSGMFALTIPHSFEKNIVIPALKQLCLEYPLLQINLKVTDQPLDLIEENLDVSIYGGELKDSNYRALPIGSAKEVFCASPNFLQRHESISQIINIKELPFIANLWQTNNLVIFKDENYHQKQAIALNHFAKANTINSVGELILQDMGIALLPEFVVNSHFEEHTLVKVLPTYCGKLWPFYLVHRFHGEKPIHISRFYQLVKHFFTKLSH